MWMQQKLAQKEYKTRHDWAGKVLHCELCKAFKFDHMEKMVYGQPNINLEWWDMTKERTILIHIIRPSNEPTQTTTDL